jgi:hypothetical protein
MNPAFLKIREIIKDTLPTATGSSIKPALETIDEMISCLITGMCREDLPYYGFELDTRIAAYSAEFLSDRQLTGLGDPFDPFYRIYELATRVPLFTALHSGRVILDQLAGLDYLDAPDYGGAHFMKGEVELSPGYSRPLREQELDFIHREAPEIINMLVNEAVAGA